MEGRLNGIASITEYALNLDMTSSEAKLAGLSPCCLMSEAFLEYLRAIRKVSPSRWSAPVAENFRRIVSSYTFAFQ